MLFPKIGNNGTFGIAVISNHSKANKSGRVEYIGFIPHMNPLLCAIGARGMMYLMRFGVGIEELPSVGADKSNPDASAFFTTPVYRALLLKDGKVRSTRCCCPRQPRRPR